MKRSEGVRTYELFANQSVSPNGYVESQPMSLKNASGYLSIQADIEEGTFDIDVYVSNFKDPSTSNWSSAISVATGLTSSDKDPIAVDLDGVHMWMKIRVTETGGSGSPAFGDGIAVCID